MIFENFNKNKKAKLLNFLWLILAGIFLLFSNGKWIIPVTTWLAPFFLLRFIKNNEPFLGLSAGLLLVNFVAIFSWKGMIPAPGIFYYVIIFTVFSIFFIPFIVDKLFCRKIKDFKFTLILPLTAVIVEYLYSITFPWGSWCTIAYSQSENIYLLQLLSITGMWGLTFLIYWFAAAVNWVWDKKFDWQKVKFGILCYLVIIVSVLIYGGLRLTFSPLSFSTVRIASVGRIKTELTKVYEDYVNNIASSGNPSEFRITDEHLNQFLRTSMTGIHDDLFELSKSEAQSGAKIIFWAENAAPVLKFDPQKIVGEEQLISRAKEFVLNNNVYLGISMQVVYNPDVLLDNKFVLIDTSGEIAFEYYKAKPIFPSESLITRTTSKNIPVHETPYGNISVVICHDMDFHDLLQQTGKLKTDILLDPSWDWRDIDPFHTLMAKFRPVEQGFSMVRFTSGGLSLATDYYGRTLASMDFYSANESRMAAYVPTKRIFTLYSKIGDFFAWLCIPILLILIVTKRTKKEAG